MDFKKALGVDTHMDVSENSGVFSQIIQFNRVFHYKPSILWYSLFLETPTLDHVSPPFRSWSLSCHERCLLYAYARPKPKL